jgi:aryl-alcohol dehydrogenase-like predicted oxidoreductase
VNVLDQRLIESGHLRKLKERGVEVHARSAFLQGLLLMDPESLPAFFEPVRSLLRDYRAAIRDKDLSPLQAAIGFVAGLPEVDVVVCGVNDTDQLEELCRNYRELDPVIFRKFGINDEQMLDPSQWQAGKP